MDMYLSPFEVQIQESASTNKFVYKFGLGWAVTLKLQHGFVTISSIELLVCFLLGCGQEEMKIF